jgi:hypothetical protein
MSGSSPSLQQARVAASLFGRRKIEEVLAVEAARAIDDRRIDLLRVVGGRQHDHAGVLCEAIELVQEEGAVVLADERVEILEHQDARRDAACAREDLAHAVVPVVPVREAAHVDARHLELGDEALQEVGLAIAGWAIEQDAPLVGDLVAGVDLARREEALHVCDEVVTQRAAKHEAVEGHVVDGRVQPLVLAEDPVLVHEDLVIGAGRRSADVPDEGLAQGVVGGDDPHPRLAVVGDREGEDHDLDAAAFEGRLVDGVLDDVAQLVLDLAVSADDLRGDVGDELARHLPLADRLIDVEVAGVGLEDGAARAHRRDRPRR